MEPRKTDWRAGWPQMGQGAWPGDMFGAGLGRLFEAMPSNLPGGPQGFDPGKMVRDALATTERGAPAPGPLMNPFLPKPMVSAMAQMAFPALSAWRSASDAVLFDINALSERERKAMAARRVQPGQLMVVHPQGVRAPAVYHSVGEFSISVDGQARVAAIVGPGATPLGVAAFARDVANAVGEPVVAPMPSFTPSDVASAMSGAYLRCDPGDLAGEEGLRPEEQALLDLVTQKPFAFRLIVAHGLGGRALARTLFAEVAQARGRGVTPPDYSRHMIIFGAAPRLPSRFEAKRIIGAADPIGWSLADSAVEIDDAPAGVGHHTNTQLPGALSVAGIVSKIETLPPRNQPAGRRKVDTQTATVYD